MVLGIVICFLYVVILTLINKFIGVKYTDLLKTENNLKKGLVIPVAICTIGLTVFAYIAGFIPSAFTYSPIISNVFLWIVPIIILAGIILRWPHARWDKFTKKGIAYMVLGALLVGFSEELLVRGILVHLLQNAGYSVLFVGIISSVIFGVMHGVNYFTGQDAKTTLGQMLTTSLIGINFYVLLIITGNLWVPIILHAVHDLSLFIQGGEVNKNDRKLSKPEIVASLSLLVLPILCIIILWLAA